MDPFCYFYFMSVMLSCLFLAALWWERADLLTLLYVMISCVFITFTYGALGKV